ncbi:MAG: NAD-dependent epimerase/dehydratase family protein [Pseudomonadales bacterium]
MEEQTICVVGVSGFVGSHVAAELLSRGYNVNGTLRNVDPGAHHWLLDQPGSLAQSDRQLSLHSANLDNKDSLYAAMQGCSGVVMCAGVEGQAPATVDLMVGGAENVLDCALALGIDRAVFTSSTGSTNPPEGEPNLKNEVEHWSDPEQQIAAGKYSPAAKTLMDRAVLEKMAASDGRLRTCVINPSLIVGPAFAPTPVNSLKAFQAIIEKRRHGERIPNGSMSLIDVRDLACLHVNALERDSVSGRFFGVKRSWHWQEILAALHRAYPEYEPPVFPKNEQPVSPTRFDLSRQRSLGCELRDLDAMLEAVVQELGRRQMI